MEVIIALLVLANPVNRWLGLLGGLMAFTTPLVTLSFLITTPEAWVPALGDAHHGFPYLSRCWSSGIERYSDAGRCCHDNGRFGTGYS